MNIDITSLMNLKGRLNNINDTIKNTLEKLNVEIDKACFNIGSYQLIESCRTVKNTMSTVSFNVNNTLNIILNFIESQLNNYTITNEEAKVALESLVSTITTTFDVNGDVGNQSLVESTVNDDTSNEQTPIEEVKEVVITDNASYAKGEKSYENFVNKIANDPARWDSINKTYYFFKEKGLNDEQIAGIIGNMTTESGFVLDIANKSNHKGLFQWSTSRHPSSFDLETQLNHAWDELQTRYSGKCYRKLNESVGVEGATRSFAIWFEGSEGAMSQRVSYSNAAYYYIKNNLA